MEVYCKSVVKTHRLSEQFTSSESVGMKDEVKYFSYVIKKRQLFLTANKHGKTNLEVIQRLCKNCAAHNVMEAAANHNVTFYFAKILMVTQFMFP